MATFQEILRKIKKENPQIREQLKSIKTEDGAPLFNDASINAIRDRFGQIYEEAQKKQELKRQGSSQE